MKTRQSFQSDKSYKQYLVSYYTALALHRLMKVSSDHKFIPAMAVQIGEATVKNMFR